MADFDGPQIIDLKPLDLKPLSVLSDWNHFLDATDTMLGCLHENHDLGLKLNNDDSLPFHELSNFGYGPLEDLPALDASSISSTAESLDLSDPLEADTWSFPESDEKEQTPAKLKTWETFYDNGFNEPRTVYISETGPRVFDAALVAEADNPGSCSTSSPGVVIRSRPFLMSLLHLGLGRESVLYRYSEDRRSFYPVLEDGRMSGYSPEAFQGLSSSLIDAGNKFQDLQKFVLKTRSSLRSSQSLVALASCFSDILAIIQCRLGHPPTPVRSLLQLQSLFERPKLILNSLTNIMRKTQGATTDEELLSRLYEVVQESEYTASWLQPFMLRMLASVSKPWLDSVSEWLGLGVGITSSCQGQPGPPSFIRSEEVIRKLHDGKEVKAFEYVFEPLSLPTFMTEEDSQIIFETGRSLRLLETHQSEHPLVKPLPVNAARGQSLQWHFSWKDVERIQAQAKGYETELRNTIKEFDLNRRSAHISQNPTHASKQDNGFEPSGISEEKAKAYISASITSIEAPLPQLENDIGGVPLDSPGSLDEYDVTREDIFVPPVSLLPILSFNPLISTQAYLTNRACLRLLFKEHDLTSHLSLLHRYNLFGDGAFASRLSHALFDPALRTAERRKGHSRTGISGLKLGSRDSWPPASSELRLALMGILADSYHQTKPSEKGSSMFRSELPGGLSFSVREMSEKELQRCMNPDSIEALDFLKLDYKPSSPLDAVITQSSLAKYDAIFRLLLRAARMLFVVGQLFRNTNATSAECRSVDVLTHSFRIESQHFVSATCNYFFEGVHANWTKLEEKLGNVERMLDQDGTESLSNLREFHERTLDRMMFALILRKRQEQVMKLLEEIFSLVLQLAKHVRLRQTASTMLESTDGAELKALHARFRKKVRVFVSVCRGLSERRVPRATTSLHEAGSRKEDEENTMGHLLLSLDINDFYTTA